MNKTLGTMFTGGALFDIGAEMAGYKTIWGFEKVDKIAAVARLNGFPVKTFDLSELTKFKREIKKVQRPNHLHASPPCPNFSNAKQGGQETPVDLALADSVCIALEHFLPDTFSLENVPPYVNSQSWGRIYLTLERLGYFMHFGNLNAADYGVPQTRNRFWCRASRGLMLHMPEPKPWKGWYEAIEDLIPELPDAQFAPWQLARLPEAYKSLIMSSTEVRENANTIKETDEPMFTLKASDRAPRAIITQATPYNPETTRGSMIRNDDQPASTVLTNSRAMKALLIGGGGNSSFADAEPGRGFREEDQPSMTQTATATPGKMRAFVADGQANSNGESITVRDAEEPIHTVQASTKRAQRAFVANGGNSNARTYAPRNGDQPHHTVTASVDKTPSKAQIEGRVVKMNIKALGRFQTVPDWYQGLTPQINGNGVPCLLAKVVMETFG